MKLIPTWAKGLFLPSWAMSSYQAETSICRQRSALSKLFFSPVVMYGCESWTVKKAECWKNDAFKLWCWKRLLRVSWTARRSNQSVLKEINLEYSLKELVLKLKLQYFTTWCEEQLIGKDPNSGKDWGQEEKGTTEDEMVAWHLWLKGHEFEQAPGDGGGQGGLACCSPWDRKELNTAEQLNNNKPRHKLVAVKGTALAVTTCVFATCVFDNLRIWLYLSLKRSITVSFYHEILPSH